MSAQQRAARLILVIGAMVVACGAPDLSEGLTGSGPTTSETRSVEPFTRIQVGNGIGLTVQIDGAQAVEVVAQENILPLIATTVEAGVLKIHSTGSFTTTSEVTVATSLPALDGISVSGGSQAQIEGLESDHLDITLRDGASLVATGRVTDVTVAASGGARAELSTLSVKTMNVELSEGATADLSVSDRLTGTASGGAVGNVVGGAVVNVQSSGGASVSSN